MPLSITIFTYLANLLKSSKRFDMKEIIGLLTLLIIFGGCQPQSKTNGLLVGVSYASINPPMGSYIAGDKLNRKFTGIHDSLYVKALVVADSKSHIAILTFDCIGMLYPTLLEIRKSVASKISKTQFNPSHIVMASTHTHEGPDVVGIYGPDRMTTGVDSVYLKKVVELAAEAIVKAWKSKQLATVRYAYTSFEQSWVENISEPGEVDSTVSILQFVAENGTSMATITNFACHPTFLDGVTTLVSADYISGLYNHLDKTFGGVNFFLQGPVGGWIQPEHEAKTFENADKRGRELGVVVEESLKKAVQMEQTQVLFKTKIFNFPLSNERFKALSAAGVVKRAMKDSITTEVAWFSIGNAQFVTHPAETSPIHSFQSKALMKTKGPKFVVEIGMDGLGYIVKPIYFDTTAKIPHSEYLTGMSVHKDAGTILLKVIEELAK